MKNIVQLLILFSFPLRESVGFNIGIPMRLGEIAMYLYTIYVILTIPINKKFKYGKINKKGIIIVTLLVINIIITIIVSLNSNIDFNFFYKYVIRNLGIAFFIFSVIIEPLYFDRKTIDLFFKYVIIIQLIMFILQILGKDIYFLNLVDYNPPSYFGFTRLKGTASEPGYLPVIIAPTLFYFRNKLGNKRYYYLGILILFFTFSSFGYLVIGIELIVNVITKFKYKALNISKKKNLSYIIISILFLVLSTLIIRNERGSEIKEILEFNIKKISNFAISNTTDYSSSSRIQHQEVLLNRFKKAGIIEQAFGQGTGSYSIYSDSAGGAELIESAAEGHNLYLSTLHDRGIFGTIFLTTLLYMVLNLSKGKRKSILTISMKYCMMIQIVHWSITGNTWLYYFWICVAICISNDIKFYEKKGEKYAV